MALTVKNDDLKSAKRFVMTKMDRAPLQAEIPKSDAPSPAPVVDKTKKVTVQQYDVVAVTFQGTNFDKVTKVLFDKVQLDILEKDAKHIVIGLTRDCLLYTSLGLRDRADQFSDSNQHRPGRMGVRSVGAVGEWQCNRDA